MVVYFVVPVIFKRLCQEIYFEGRTNPKNPKKTATGTFKNMGNVNKHYTIE